MKLITQFAGLYSYSDHMAIFDGDPVVDPLVKFAQRRQGADAFLRSTSDAHGHTVPANNLAEKKFHLRLTAAPIYTRVITLS